MTSVARPDEDSGDYPDSPDVERNNSTNDGGHVESDYDSAGSESEHSEQDPESQETERRVDDDEDRSNPQYIPKRGTFYEHDDRTAASGEESANTTSETASEKKEGSEPAAERRRAPRKSEVIDRWSHDKYNENEQVPKSRDELVSIYGYDIRNEDAPPHARRNRRYGRGPNKYTRTWEDEEAYRRQTAAAAPRKPPTAEDFPALEPANRRDSRRPRGPRPRSKSQPTSNESLENSDLRRNASIRNKKPEKQTPKPPPKNSQINVKKEKLPQIENLTITTVVNSNSNSPGQTQRKVNPAVAQQKPVPTEQGKKKPPQVQPPPPARSKTPPPPAPAPQAQPTESRGGSKRYSSLRQRPLAETYSPQTQPAQAQPQPTPTPHRYHNEYAGNPPPAPQHQGSPAPQMHPQQIIHQAHRNANQPPHGPSPPHQNLPQPPHSQQVRLGILEQQQLVSHQHHSMHNMPPQPHTMVAAPIPQAQGYAPPAMMPAQYMQQSSNNAVYGGAGMYATPPPAPYPHPLYQHHNFQVAQATHAGGVTYYSPVEQEPPAPAPRAPRRPTAAIPIVRPDRPANSSEKDNIDRIVENMFVRKPWPATQHGFDGSKEKNETRNSQEAPSKESSQPNSLTSSSISTDSKPSEKEREVETEAKPEEDKKSDTKEDTVPESIAEA